MSEPEDTGEPLAVWLDAAHDEISKQIIGTAMRFDQFFGDERSGEEKQTTEINIFTALKVTQGDAPEWTFPINLNVDLPRLKNRFQVMLETLLEESDEGDLATDKKIEPTDLKVRIRYKIFQQAMESVSFDGGIKVNPDQLDTKALDPFGILRIRRTSNWDPWALRLTQFLSWYQSDGFSAVSRFDLDRRFRTKTFVRISGKAEYAESMQGIHAEQVVILRQQLSRKRALGMEFKMTGRTSPAIQTDLYTVNLAYRRRVYRKWIFGSLTPEIQFDREDRFKAAPSIKGQLELHFGSSAP